MPDHLAHVTIIALLYYIILNGLPCSPQSQALASCTAKQVCEMPL